MCQSIVGQKNIICEIDKKKLLFLQSLVNMPEQTHCKKIFLRRLFQFTIASNTQQTGFIPDVFSVLDKYGLRNYFKYDCVTVHLPSKFQWKRLVKNTIKAKENELLAVRLDADIDFSRFKSIHNTYSPAIVWLLP